MRKFKLAVLFAAALFTVAATSAVVYARDSDDASGSMMGGGMMGRGMMSDGMMGRMSRMMSHCGDMMRGDHGSGRPNEQWRDSRPPAPNDHN
jgi:hypothetical protein